MEGVELDDELTLSGFKKIEEKFQIDGYADGLSNGRDSLFQEGFDAGYEDGFSLGFTLGQYKALISSDRNKLLTKELNYASKGECQVCVNSELIKQDLNDLRDGQQTKIEEVVHMLTEKYGSIQSLEVQTEVVIKKN